ncbi:zinc finger domain-containing protein [Streptomyces flaveolus]|uniref:zinc finger domain-containing protein n=1 Tax=Streptomyces flaveolus TaxID=67297 RepID=UPI00382E1E89
MDRREIAALLAYIGRLDPRTIRTDQGEARDQLAQWHELLADVPVATPHGWDARVAARRHIRVSPYQILPADIGRPWESYRRDRLNRHTDPTPSADPDDQGAWTAELVRTRHAVATGQRQPTEYRQIGSRRIDPRLRPMLEEAGSCIPQEARAALAPWRTARAAHEAALARGELDVLSVPCAKCGAAAGRPCRIRRIDPGGFPRGNKPIAEPHECRRDLAAAQQDRRAAAV